MSEFLTVRLSRQTDAPIPWLVWSVSQNEVIASGELSHRNELDQLLPYARQRTTIALLDSRDVLLSECEIPAGALRQLDSMIPYLLEEEIAQDVEELHYTILNRGAGRASVAAVDEKYLAGWLKRFRDAGIELKRVLPDVLAMPLIEQQISALQIGKSWLFRKDLYQGMAADTQWLNTLFESDWCKQEQSKLPITGYTPAPDYPFDAEQQWNAAEPELVMALLTKGAIASPVNLLTGEFKPQSSMLKHIRIWRKVAIAACLFVTVLSVQQLLKVNQLEAEAKAYRAESERIFRSVFPDKRKIPTVSYLKRQMNDEANRLSGNSSGDTVLDWLADLPQILANQPAVEIQSIRFDANRAEARIEMLMADFQTFEVIRSRLEQQYVVTQGPLNKKESKVSGSYVLRRKQ
ncbi:type II secretion system protein GspL [Vibrio sp. SCSIO 43137]|uniref:type II secretion system protein GspL n=1 Tax=Vibrio sp. SCSIO 43137 TaxID=3021011 RepID=UPI002307FDF7|nr:type II secretion system protein GspL [Vibrio sp. SCSIO 43137]WCE29808.1 type II secretion system protein GspL [Vibrio sp. SCSIO 43137]